MRSTAVIALAALLACLPAQAVEVIDLHNPHNLHDPYLLHGMQRTGYSIEHRSEHRFGYLPGYLPGEAWGDIPPAPLPDLPLPAESGPVAVVPGAAPVPTPVPEPMAVLMLACGLLLIMPGAWAARLSRLGDSESLLQRRLP